MSNDAPIRLLLVEDSPADALLLRELLESAYPGQYVMDIAADLEAAKGAIAKQDLEAILLDLSLPDSQGIETVERLVEVSGSVPIIVLTGLDDEDGAAEAVRCGAQDYLRKGCTDAESVAKAIRHAIDRKKADTAQRESEQRYRSLVENVSLGVTLIGPDYRIRMVNGAHARLFGKRPDEMVGKECFREFEKRSGVCPQCPGRQAMESGVCAEAETEAIRDDGHQHAVRVQAFPLLDPAGEATGFIEVVEDITEGKRAEELLRESEENYRLLFENMAEGFALYELLYDDRGQPADWRVLQVNDAYTRHTGVARERIVGRRISEVFPSAIPEYLQRFSQVVATQTPVEADTYAKPIGRYQHVATFPAGGNRFANAIEDITERKEAEKALRKSETALRQAQRVAHVGSWAWHIQTNRLEWSDEMYRIFGIEKETFSGKLGDVIAGSIHPDDRAKVEQSNLSVILTKKPVPLEYRVVWPDQTVHVVWAEAGELTLDEAGNAAVLTGIVQDITERKRAEQLLRESEEKFRSLFENAEVGMFRTKLDGSAVIDMNQRYLDIFGLSRQEMAGKPSTIHWADLSKREEMVRRLRASGSVSQAECRMLNKRGEVRNCLTSLRLDPAQGVLEGSIIDITDRKRAELALHESTERLDLAMRSSRMGAFEWDIVANKRSWDATVHSLLGTRPETFSGTTEEFYKIVHPADRKAVEDYTGKALRSGNYETSYRVVWADGSVHHIAARGRIHRDEANRPVRMLGVCWDITEQKQTQEEREQLQAQFHQAQKMEAVGRLAAGVAHDFNNQLTVIQGYCDLLLAGRDEDDPLWEPLSEIRRASTRATSTTSHLLSFSRKQILHPEAVNLKEQLLALQGLVGRMVGEDIQLSVVAACDVPTVLLDKAGLQQALMNLIVNARDAMPQGGQLMLRTSRIHVGAGEGNKFGGAAEGPYVLLEVADTGVGMDQRILERIFDPFFTTKDVGKGTGLGLAMVQGFVRQSHGFIDVLSEPGKGTTARILLPPAADPKPLSASKAAETPSCAKGRNETILVVEDEEGVRSLMVRALQDVGYRVLDAAGPTQALEIVAKHEGPLDLLITDMVMPEMNGADLAIRVTAVRKSIRTLFVTGYFNEEARKKVSNVLLKPFGTDELLARVLATLDNHKSSDERTA